VSEARYSEAKANPKSRRKKHEGKSVYALVIVYVAEKSGQIPGQTTP